MKILRLDLRAFGPFTDVTLNFEGGEPGMHVIYGLNEAGKSATRRALRQFLYGIDERTTDAFRHPYDKLRIGGQLRHSSGAIIECVRRKARVNALRGTGDKTVLDLNDFSWFLGDVDQMGFETMFSIDHKTLVQGGHGILDTNGRLGPALFAAGSGVADLRAIQEGLQTEIGELFRPAGRTQRISKALGELRDTQVAVKRQQLSAEEWARHDRALRDAEQKKQQVDVERQQYTRDLSRLTRMHDALPDIARRKSLVIELADYLDVILLSPDFSGKRQSALETLRVAEDQARQAQQTLEEISQELQRLEVPGALLEEADRIDDLHRRLGEYQKDMKDRPIRLVQEKNLEHDAKEILRSLRRRAELEEAEHVRLSVDEPLRIQNLGTQQQGVSTRLESARQFRDELKSRIDQAKQRLASVTIPADPAELRRLIRSVQNEGPVEEKLVAQIDKVRQTEKQVAIDLARLTLWSGSLDALEQLALPSAETVDRFENEVSQLQSMYDQQRNRVRDVDTELRDLGGQIDRLEREQAVPSEADLQRARRLRDAGWGLVRQAWLEGSALGPETAAFLSNFAPASDLAGAYERSVESADSIADRLRREANRVASKAKLLADQSQRREQLEKLNDQLGEIRQQLTQLDTQWTALWKPLNIQPLPPREMRTWLRKHGELARQIQALRQERAQVVLMEERIQLQREHLSSSLQRLNEADARADEALVALVGRCQEVIDRYDRLKREREGLERELAGHIQDFPLAEARANQAEAELTRWQEQWAAAMSKLGLDAHASAAQANAVLAAITTLLQKLREADGFRRRIDGIDRDAGQFQADVQATLQRAAPDLAPWDVETATKELHSRLQSARSRRQTWQNLLKQQEQEASKLSKSRGTLTATQVRLDAMCREAGCATFDELPHAERRSAHRQQVESDIRHCERHLLTLSAGIAIEEFITDAARIDADSIDSAIQRLQKTVGELEIAISRLDQTIGSERALLAGMKDNAAASDSAETAQSLLAQLQCDVQHYVVLRLGAAVLQEAIERYRKKNQGPVLTRASRLFADLTVGSFESLQIDYDEAGVAVLIGVRSGSRETVGVTGMSDGSCDQLYLSLRLASLEAYLETHEPIPFVVDDILLNFDNDRAVAALKALAELSLRTQVVFFTHHEHLVTMVKKFAHHDNIFIHALPAGSSQTAI